MVPIDQDANTATFTVDELPDLDGVMRNPHGQRSAYTPSSTG
ncbi:hypothetical protein ACFYR1_34955 [Streptomyces canus]